MRREIPPSGDHQECYSEPQGGVVICVETRVEGGAVAGPGEGRVRWSWDAPLDGWKALSHCQAVGWGRSGAVMSSRLALTGLTHGEVLCEERRSSSCLPGGPGQGGRGPGGYVSAVR